MKIVTTWHRGSVATGEEIREGRNNKRRLFSYSLIILFSLCRGGEAAAAKLCQHTSSCSWGGIDVATKTFFFGCKDTQISTYPAQEDYNGVYACTSSRTADPDNVSAAGQYCWCKLLRVPENSPLYNKNYANVWRYTNDGCAAFGEANCATWCQRGAQYDTLGYI